MNYKIPEQLNKPMDYPAHITNDTITCIINKLGYIHLLLELRLVVLSVQVLLY